MVKILKVSFDNVSKKDALAKIFFWLQEKTQRQISTPNPEMLLEALKNPKFREILNHSDLKIPDGIGILWAAKYLDTIKGNRSKIIKKAKWFSSLCSVILRPSYIRHPLTERVTGVDLMESICAQAATNSEDKIFLLGAGEGVAELAKEKLVAKYPGIKITGVYAASPSEKEEQEIKKRIDKSEANILFVAYGAPKQEIWISRNLKNFKSVQIAMGIGGAFDFIAGARKRAPQLMSKMGLEWLYRLIQEPKRIKRIYNATVKFPIAVLKKALK